MRLRNISPLGHLDFPLIGRVLEPGEVFGVDDEVGTALLEQVGNFKAVVNGRVNGRVHLVGESGPETIIKEKNK